MRAGPLSDVVGQAVKDLLLLVETDCVAGHVRLELANVSSDSAFETPNNCSWLGRKPDYRDHSRLS